MKSYTISGMTCQNCVEKIKSAIQEVEGIQNPKVTLDPPQLELSEHSQASFSEIQKAIQSAGNYKLLDSDNNHQTSSEQKALIKPEEKEDLTPLFIIVSYIIGGTLLIALLSSTSSIYSLMSYFMGLFFVTFSLFKMIDLAGFKDAFSTYDLLAKRFPLYAKYYPFLELLLGILYLSQIALTLTNIVTATIMLIGSIGVLKALMKDQTIQCACLGTALNLPMTKVTLTEDLLMGLMALTMLYTG